MRMISSREDGDGSKVRMVWDGLVIVKQGGAGVAMGNRDRRSELWFVPRHRPTCCHDCAESFNNCIVASSISHSRVESMASLNGAPADTVAPGHADTSITKEGFKITTRKLPILKAGPIEEMTKKLGIAPPEMIFGDNMVRIEHAQSGWYIEFNAFDALDLVDKTGEKMFKVSYSQEWQQNR
jgi:hypothetical protein